MESGKFLLEVRIDTGSITEAPHVFMVLTDEFGNDVGYGFGPSEHGDIWGPGEVRSDTKHGYDDRIPYEITAQQYEDLISFIYQRQKDPGIYEGWNRNCVDFVSSALRYAGIDDLPNGPLTHPIELWWRSQTLGMTNSVGRLIGGLQKDFATAKFTVSPLILDLDGDGVETIGKSAGIHFDHDGNQFAETTGWVGKDDGLLVWDRNGNGVIDNGLELFGNNTGLSSGAKADNGFSALAELDTNFDGKVDAQDTSFSQLLVWQDKDSDARASEGELRTLAVAGVQSLSVAFRSQRVTDSQGNQLLQAGSYTQSDGSERAMIDVWFVADRARTLDKVNVPVSDEIALLPDLPGFGNVPSLHQAIARDASGKLFQLVSAIANEKSPSVQRALIEGVLFAWTGSDQYGPSSRGKSIGDGRTLYTLEAFLGERFSQDNWPYPALTDPGPDAGALLREAFSKVADFYLSLIQAQTSLRDLYSTVALAWDAEAGTFKLNLDATVGALNGARATDAATGAALMQEFGFSLESMGGDFSSQVLRSLRYLGFAGVGEFNVEWATIGMKLVAGSNAADSIRGLDSRSSQLVGKAGNDWLQGGARDDYLDGGEGDDWLDGGAGNDWLVGGAGDDKFSGRDGDDKISCGDGNDKVYGGPGDDWIDAGAGNDTLEGGEGNDTYVAHGGGVTSIYDSDWSSRVRDAVYWAGVASTDITAVERQGDLLLLKAGGGGQLRVANYFRGYRIEQFGFSDGVTWGDLAIKSRALTVGTIGKDSIYGYDEAGNRIVGYDDGDSLYGGSKGDLLDGGNGDDYLRGEAGDDTLLGGEGNDTLLGGAGDDLLDAGLGNNSLSGDKGSDVYVLRGAGLNTINDYDTTAGAVDVVILSDVASTEVTAIERRSGSLVLKYGEGRQLTVASYFSDQYAWIEQFRFCDGVSWDNAAIKARVMTWGSAYGDTISGYNDASNRMSGLEGNDNLTGGRWDDQIDGGSGDDCLYGEAGNDALSGMSGNDRLYGWTGNDLLDGGDGDDVLIGVYGNDLFVGGAGNDQVVTSSDANVIAFNRGDGKDSVTASAGKGATLSLGKGIGYADLKLSKSGRDLVLSTGTEDSVTLKDWYASSAYRGVSRLQIVGGTLPRSDGAPTDVPRTQAIQVFDFDALVKEFDKARVTQIELTSWNVMDELMDTVLFASDTEAIGGTLALRVATEGGVGSIAAMAAMDVGAGLANPLFGLAPQPLAAAFAAAERVPAAVG